MTTVWRTINKGMYKDDDVTMTGRGQGGGCVALWLERRTPDRSARDQGLAKIAVLCSWKRQR